MITDKTIEVFQDAVKTETIPVNGVEFTTRPVFRVPLEQFQKEPQPTPLVLHSLTALIQYVKSVGEAGTISNFVHVESPSQVSVLGMLYGPSKQRDTLAVAKFEHSAFPFGSSQNNEEFVVMLQARFAAAGDRDAVLKVVGNIKEEAVVQRTDDGITQTVVGKSGITKSAELDVPNPVHLAPFRTFPEIEQPISPFVLRMKQGQPLPQCSLHEADGGAWVNVARLRILELLSRELEGVTILA